MREWIERIEQMRKDMGEMTADDGYLHMRCIKIQMFPHIDAEDEE
jgi:hypothetical protein